MEEGSICYGLYFISKGEADSGTGHVVTSVIGSGDHFNLDCLFHARGSDVTVTARSYCEIFYLDSADFIRIVTSMYGEGRVTELSAAYTEHQRTSHFVGEAVGGVSARTGPLRKIASTWRRHMFPETTFRRWWAFAAFLGVTYNTFSVPSELALL